jgi:glycosyltransferase involved in cell wall biosynthesis
MKDKIWLTWENQRRNRTTSDAVDAQLFEFYYPQPAPVRHIRSALSTLALLLRERPRVVFAQNPSLVLAMLVTRYGKLTGTPVIIDAHNAGIRPFDGRSRWASALNRRVIRDASLTIVSNAALAQEVRRQGGRPAVLPDPLPHLPPPVQAAPMTGAFNVLFVCTWAPDEPYLEVLAAAARLDPSVRIYVTGNSKGRERAFGALPPNVELTGFVSEEQFVALLHAADLVMDLTTREDCLVCGAYEAVAVGKPLLLSGTEALRGYFHRGAVYTDNTAEDIARRIEEARSREAELITQVSELRRDIEHRWSEHHRELLTQIQALMGPDEADVRAS